MSAQTSHLACTYAVLLLQDEGLPINAVNINKLIDNAHISGVERFYAKLYTSNITPAVIASTVAAGGSTSGAAAAAAGASTSADKGSKPAEKDTKAPGKYRLDLNRLPSFFSFRCEKINLKFRKNKDFQDVIKLWK